MSLRKIIRSALRSIGIGRLGALDSFGNPALIDDHESDNGGLALCYDNLAHTDGAGAQIQRILGIYCISKLLGCKYVHCGLESIGYQGLGALESGDEIAGLADLYNRLFALPTEDGKLTRFGDNVYRVKNTNKKSLLKLRSRLMRKNCWGLLMITYPYGISDKFPECYLGVEGLVNHNSLELLPTKFIESNGTECNRPSPEELVVAVHIRRGELFAVDSHRMLSMDYYFKICRRIETIAIGCGLRPRFDIYTEIPTSNFSVTGKSHGIKGRIVKPVTFCPEQVDLSIFSKIDNVNLRINEHQVSTLFNLSVADVLVSSRSSFSYVAAIAGEKKVVISPQFWHTLLESWVESHSVEGTFDDKKLIRGIYSLNKFKRNTVSVSA